METEEILLVKLAEEVRASAMGRDEKRCKQKLSELESFLDRLEREEDRDKVEEYIDNIELTGISYVLPELIHFTDSIIGKYIGDNISDLTPTDAIVFEESDISMEELFERGAPEIIGGTNDILNKDPDRVIENEINPRFGLEINPENINHDMKVLLSYLVLEYKAVLEWTSDEVITITDQVEERKKKADQIDEKLHESIDVLEEIGDDDVEYEPPSDEVMEIVEDVTDDEAHESFMSSIERLTNRDQDKD
jgi:hypothetical protein